MQVFLSLCVYCERTIDEICLQDGLNSREDALEYVVVNTQQVCLCRKCRRQFITTPNVAVAEVGNAPIDFPPGITAIDHCCPELEYRGVPAKEADLELKMEFDGHYYVATCPHCGITVRSLAVQEE